MQQLRDALGAVTGKLGNLSLTAAPSKKEEPKKVQSNAAQEAPIQVVAQKAITPSNCELSKLDPRLWNETLPGNVRLKIASLLNAPLCQAFDITCIVNGLLNAQKVGGDIRVLDKRTRKAMEDVSCRVRSLNFTLTHHNSLALKDLCYRFQNCTSFTLHSYSTSVLKELQELPKLQRLALYIQDYDRKFPSGIRLAKLQALHLTLGETSVQNFRDLEPEYIEDLLQASPQVSDFCMTSDGPLNTLQPFMKRKDQFRVLEIGSASPISDEEWRKFIDAQTNLRALVMHNPRQMTDETFAYLCKTMKHLQKLEIHGQTALSASCISQACAQLPLRSFLLHPMNAENLYKNQKPLLDLFKIPTLKSVSITMPCTIIVDFLERPVDVEELVITVPYYLSLKEEVFRQSHVKKLTLLSLCKQEYINYCSQVKGLTHLCLESSLVKVTNCLLPLIGVKTLQTLHIYVSDLDNEMSQELQTFQKAREDVTVILTKNRHPLRS